MTNMPVAGLKTTKGEKYTTLAAERGDGGGAAMAGSSDSRPMRQVTKSSLVHTAKLMVN
jgi:hypothetical protein